MFAVVRDTNNLYRWYQSGDSLVAEKKVGGVKTTLVDLQYSAATHQFLRIRKVANAATGTQDVVFETAPDNGGVAGTLHRAVPRHLGQRRERDRAEGRAQGRHLGAEVGAGSAYWDNVLVAQQLQVAFASGLSAAARLHSL